MKRGGGGESMEKSNTNMLGRRNHREIALI